MSVRAATRRLRSLGAAAVNAVVGKAAVALLALVRRLDPDRSIEFAARQMRRIGPLLPEHRIGRTNLSAAFPEKPAAEIETILREVWANVGRVGAEFAHLDRLWDLDLDHPGAGRIDVTQEVIQRYYQLRNAGQPVLCFAAHYGNWELSAIAAVAHGVSSAVLYRAPNIGDIDRFIREIRATNMGILVPTTLDAPVRIANLLQSGISVGMVVDQHYSRGVEVTFFGRRCLTNPLIARLARQVDCPIYGTRIVRLPENRFRIDLIGPVEPQRDAEGRVDVAGTTQVITTIIEGWIREHPEQWLWLHRRWR